MFYLHLSRPEAMLTIYTQTIILVGGVVTYRERWEVMKSEEPWKLSHDSDITEVLWDQPCATTELEHIVRDQGLIRHFIIIPLQRPLIFNGKLFHLFYKLPYY
jgi:hypothetical protein